jgi:hypothetical protein
MRSVKIGSEISRYTVVPDTQRLLDSDRSTTAVIEGDGNSYTVALRSFDRNVETKRKQSVNVHWWSYNDNVDPRSKCLDCGCQSLQATNRPGYHQREFF